LNSRVICQSQPTVDGRRPATTLNPEKIKTEKLKDVRKFLRWKRVREKLVKEVNPFDQERRSCGDRRGPWSKYLFALLPNSTPCGQPTPNRPNGQLGVGRPQDEFSILVTKKTFALTAS
jgi:hypothetical protein